MEVIFDKLDMNIEEFKLLSDKYLLVPEQSAGMLIIAFYNYIKDENLGVEMINILKEPEKLSNYEISFLKDRFYDKKYLPKVYFKGATPENDYTPDKPYTIRFLSDKKTETEEYVKVYIKESAFDTPRSITLRKKADKYFIWEYSGIVMGVRKPISENPWG